MKTTKKKPRIRELWSLNTFPDGWSGEEVIADIPLDRITTFGHDLIVQPLLVGGE